MNGVKDLFSYVFHIDILMTTVIKNMLLKTVLTLFLKSVNWLSTAVKFQSAVIVKTTNTFFNKSFAIKATKYFLYG
ncbi:hypothetical protein A0G03_16205 [Pectobacterium peruviense]|uniref:Uncharacterized protein n=1 Tax=Pectobacterium peruviense TaxID=2066479 RepID=A0ABX4S571_9GAMM|nr:hypothetical protein G033_04845 [Pectobacterium peruviense]PKX85299.1 hypothetical protein A0G03_16205 [Pectobacterium peruviense]